MTAAVVCIINATRPDTTLESFVSDQRGESIAANARALIIEQLGAAGWTMQQPYVEPDGGSEKAYDVEDHQDVIVFLRKDFDTSEAAEAEAKACGCTERWNFSLLWNLDGTLNERGWPNHEWSGEL